MQIHLFVIKTPKGFLAAITDLDQRRPIVIRRAYHAMALISRLLEHASDATTSSSRPTIDATGNATLPSASTSPERDNPQSLLFTEVQIRHDQLRLVKYLLVVIVIEL